MKMYTCSECQDELEIPDDCSCEELFLIEEDWFSDDGAGMGDHPSRNKRRKVALLLFSLGCTKGASATISYVL